MEHEKSNTEETALLDICFGHKIIFPLEMIWQPKEDITTYELAMCIPYFFMQRRVMPYEIDESLPHFRHFEIINRNI
jgi:hypothetical protein